MTDKKESPAKSKLSADWLVRGVLTKLGDTFDRLMGRDWKPTSTLATSELIERMKKLLDLEVRETDGRGRFVPHNIKLKMQWDKFSTDAEDQMKRLEGELLVAAIDHINDNRYHTYAPLKVEIKPDYFTDGVKLQASFDEFAPDESDLEMNVTVPEMKVGDLIPGATAVVEADSAIESFIAEFSASDKQKSVELKFRTGARLSVGRTKENDLSIDDPSISKHHATLMVNGERKFLVADTGSTNGTFFNGERMAYGKASAVGESDKVKFGNVEVFFRRVPKQTDFVTEEEHHDADGATANLQPQINGSTDGRQESQAAGSYKTDGFEADRTAASPPGVPRQTVESPGVENSVTSAAKSYSEANGDLARTEQGINFNLGNDGKS